jgi:putative RNA 2'-phosphotransferase
MDQLVKKSKHLSLVLRHKPESAGLTLDDAGWVEVSKLLPAMKMTIEELKDVVENNNKQRFEFNIDESKIRARQGHSVDVDLGYKPEVPPDVLFHGTVKSSLDSIMKEGLKKMNRLHVHLSPDMETAIKVGSRRGIAVLLKIDAKRMHEAGIKFYHTDNNVWLTDNVPAKYIS